MPGAKTSTLSSQLLKYIFLSLVLYDIAPTEIELPFEVSVLPGLAPCEQGRFRLLYLIILL